ncbi:hypothetical protein EGW08_009849, partial [Elysia chlorotica]
RSTGTWSRRRRWAQVPVERLRQRRDTAPELHLPRQPGHQRRVRLPQLPVRGQEHQVQVLRPQGSRDHWLPADRQPQQLRQPDELQRAGRQGPGGLVQRVQQQPQRQALQDVHVCSAPALNKALPSGL